MSDLFGGTLREAPGGVEGDGHRYLLRGGFLRQLGQGSYSLLPLGVRSIRRVESILRDEMTRIGAQEVELPIVVPGRIWQTSGRFYSVGPELVRLKDRRDRDLLLAMTHEEVVATLAASEISSYRDLPATVFQLQTKYRDDPRPRAGLIRTREFVMKDSYSLDRDEEGLNRSYESHFNAYLRIFDRCELPVIPVAADVGMMGGSLAHEFMYLSPLGEDTIVICASCRHSQNRQVAAFKRPKVENEVRHAREIIDTPGVTSITALCTALAVSAQRVVKSVAYTGQRFSHEGISESVDVLAVVRGDMEVSETKIGRIIGVNELAPMTPERAKELNLALGFVGPVEVSSVPVIADELLRDSVNMVVGANVVDRHIVNVNPGRDWAPHQFGDIAAASDGFECLQCGGSLTTSRGVEVGNIFKLGTKYSEYFDVTYLDESGVARLVWMGSYGIGVGRLLACIAEEHHDDRGLVWPRSTAPFDVHIVHLEGEAAASRAMAIAHAVAEDYPTLIDDRDLRAGSKFADADLIGAPIRVVVSQRGLANDTVEVLRRGEQDAALVDVNEVEQYLRDELGRHV